jgi:hypothetical protein
MVDMLASEYGWSIETISNMPIDQTSQLIHALLHRKGVKVYLKTYEVDDQHESLADRIAKIMNLVDIEE